MATASSVMFIKDLLPGDDYPGGSINSRHYNQKEVEGMKASIGRLGILQSLMVIEKNKRHYVAAGNLRRLAIAELVKEKKLDALTPIPVQIFNSLSDVEALAASLEENRARTPLHPVNTYEVFADRLIEHRLALVRAGEFLLGKGWTQEQIAERYGMDVKTTRGVLALGQLSPAVRKAWLKGDLTQEAAEAFTLASDHKQQDAALARLKKRGGWYLKQKDAVRREICGDENEAAKLLEFVGTKDYEAAGGELIVDLFGGKPAVADPAILKKLADEKIAKVCADLVAKGWKWAATKSMDPAVDQHWSWPRVPGGKGASAASRARSGCVVRIDYDGKVQIEYGVVRPADRKADKEAKGKKKAKGGISNALKMRLVQQRDKAVKAVLADPKSAADVLPLLGKLVASMIRPERPTHVPNEVRDAIAKIRDGVSSRPMLDALSQAFDAKDYFGTAPKPLVVRAIAEALGKDKARPFEKQSGAAARKFAIANVPKTKWLPPELRPGS